MVRELTPRPIAAGVRTFENACTLNAVTAKVEKLTRSGVDDGVIRNGRIENHGHDGDVRHEVRKWVPRRSAVR